MIENTSVRYFMEMMNLYSSINGDVMRIYRSRKRYNIFDYKLFLFAGYAKRDPTGSFYNPSLHQSNFASIISTMTSNLFMINEIFKLRLKMHIDSHVAFVD